MQLLGRCCFSNLLIKNLLTGQRTASRVATDPGNMLKSGSLNQTCNCQRTKYSEKKLSRNLSCLKTRPDLKCFSSALNKYVRLKNAKGTNRRSPTMPRFYPCCFEFLQSTCLFNVGMEYSRSNLVFKMRKKFYFRNALSDCEASQIYF